MLIIIQNNIRLTKGDSLYLEIGLTDEEGAEFIPEEDDTIRFAMKKKYQDTDCLILKEVPHDTMTLHLEPSDTKELEVGSYVYDIELTTGEAGDVDTFISGTFELMADNYLNKTGLSHLWDKVKSYIDKRYPSIQTSGNWLYRIYADKTFEAWYKATGQTITINAGSGNLYRSELRTLALPTEITSQYTIAVQHSEVNTAHNNYPCWGMLASISATGINYYAMSGGSRSASPNYTITGYMFGKLS